MKRPGSQNKPVGDLRISFRARKVFGTFEKRAPGHELIRIVRGRFVILIEFSMHVIAFISRHTFSPFIGKVGKCPLASPRQSSSCLQSPEHECDVDADCKSGLRPLCCQDSCNQRYCAVQLRSRLLVSLK